MEPSGARLLYPQRPWAQVAGTLLLDRLHYLRGLHGKYGAGELHHGRADDGLCIEPWVVGVGIALIVGIVIIGGQKRITTVAELVVPFMAIAYILGSLVIMCIYFDQIPQAFAEVFREAFSTKAAAGGAAGIAMKYAIRYGVARGLFSNEAGMGTSPHAHAMAEVKDPAMQGFVAMSGVFVDLLICTATALIILLTGAYAEPGLISVQITQRASRRPLGRPVSSSLRSASSSLPSPRSSAGTSRGDEYTLPLQVQRRSTSPCDRHRLRLLGDDLPCGPHLGAG